MVATLIKLEAVVFIALALVGCAPGSANGTMGTERVRLPALGRNVDAAHGWRVFSSGPLADVVPPPPTNEEAEESDSEAICGETLHTEASAQWRTSALWAAFVDCSRSGHYVTCGALLAWLDSYRDCDTGLQRAARLALSSGSEKRKARWKIREEYERSVARKRGKKAGGGK